MTTSSAEAIEAVDLAVVGAGPAGLAAAVTAAESSAHVMLIDSGARAGGQYYRRAPMLLTRRPGDPPHHPWPAFDDLESRLESLVRAGQVQVCHDTTVWAAERHDTLLLRTRRGDRHAQNPTGVVAARALVLAAGAHDRHLPFPGWDLPGVMSGGGAQALIKGSHVKPGRRVVVAGTGPFLLAVAATLLEAGVGVVAVVEANAPESLVVRAPALMAGAGKARELARFVALLARHRVPYLRRHRVVRAHGDGAVQAVTVARVDRDWRPVPGTERRLECDTVAVGFGFTAQVELPLQLGCRMSLGADGGLAVVVDESQGTSVADVFAAGEATGVGGSDLALSEGLLAGAMAARGLGLPESFDRAALRRLRRRIRGLRRFADALHSAFDVRAGWEENLNDDTLMCRCEEVSVLSVRGAIESLGASDARTVKLFTRAGMGWCQGRMCGFAIDQMCRTVETDSEDGDGDSPARRLAAASTRPLVVPVPLRALALLAPDDRDNSSDPDTPIIDAESPS